MKENAADDTIGVKVMSVMHPLREIPFLDYREFSRTSIIRVYSAILLGILVTAGSVLAVVSFGFGRNLRSIWATYASWCVLGPLTFAVIYWGRVPAILFFVILALVSVTEYARATGLLRDWGMTSALYLAIFAASAAALMPNRSDGSPGGYGLYMSLPAFAMALFMLMPVLRNRTQGQLHLIALAFLGFILIGWMFLHLALLADSPNVGYLLYLLLAVELNDVAAFVFGRLLGGAGKHQLRSRISPQKTWEGALGAVAFSMALPWLLRFSLPDFDVKQLILSGLIVGIGGQLGDLSISLIKRELQLKNMGALIPGHGGVLDRIDSLIYCAPLFQHMVCFYKG